MKKFLLLVVAFATVSLTAQVTLYEDDFEAYTSTNNVGEQTDIPTGFIGYDNDGDVIGWGVSNPVNFTQPFGDIYLGNNFITSASFVTTGVGGNGANGALSPDNILVLPMVSIPTGATGVNLNYFVGSGTDPNFFSEAYTVQVTSTSDLADILAATPVLNTTLAFQGGEVVTINLDAFIGQDVFISFRHFNTTDQWLIGIDDITVIADAVAAVDDNVLASSVSVYPTAVDQDFTINNRSTIALNTASIFDVNGRLIAQHNLNGLVGEKTINVSSLSAGLYFVELASDNGKAVKKLIKK